MEHRLVEDLRMQNFFSKINRVMLYSLCGSYRLGCFSKGSNA